MNDTGNAANDAIPKVLIVEDNAVFGTELAGRLGDLGCHVSGVADNVIDALVLAREVPPDLVIMDIVLEGHMSGIDAALLFATMRVPVIYVTAYADADTIRRAASALPYGFVRKPLRGDEFERTVTSALQAPRRRH